MKAVEPGFCGPPLVHCFSEVSEASRGEIVSLRTDVRCYVTRQRGQAAYETVKLPTELNFWSLIVGFAREKKASSWV